MRVHNGAASLVIATVCMVFATAPAECAPLVDQQQPVIDDSVGGLAIGGFSDELLAQTFTVGLAGDFVEVDLPIACSTGDPLILEIQGVAATGEPDGTVLRSQTYSGAGLPSFFPDPPFLRPFVLSVPLPVTVGDRLAIVLNSPGECGIFQGPLGDPYAGGDGWFDARPNPPGWLQLSTGLLPADQRFDLPFATVVDDGTLEVDIDFLYRSRMNRFNPRRGGSVDFAVLTSPSFDATTVDWTTAAAGPAGAGALGPGSAVDVDGDGDVDLVLDFNARDLGVACGDTTITLLATTFAGDEIRGVDAITVVGCGRR